MHLFMLIYTEEETVMSVERTGVLKRLRTPLRVGGMLANYLCKRKQVLCSLMPMALRQQLVRIYEVDLGITFHQVSLGRRAEGRLASACSGQSALQVPLCANRDKTGLYKTFQ